MPDSLMSVIEEFTPELERLEKLVAGLSVLADRLSGSRPTDTAASNSLDGPANSMIDNLQRKRRALANLIISCEQEFDRLNSSVGD